MSRRQRRAADRRRGRAAAVAPRGRTPRAASTTSPLIDRYAWYEIVGIYAGIALFLSFLLAPFVEGFLVSLKPLVAAVLLALPLHPARTARSTPTGRCGRACRASALHLQLLLHLDRRDADRARAGGPGGLCLRALRLPGRGAAARRLPRGQHVLGRRAAHPALPADALASACSTPTAAMIVPGAAFLIPSAIWLLRTYMMRIPRELDEAAWVDGASHLYTLRRVILPIAMPGIIVVAITTFIGAYAQQFIFALTFNSKTEYMPLPVGLFAFFGKQEVVWNELMAASLRRHRAGDDPHLLPATLSRRRAHRRRRETVRQPSKQKGDQIDPYRSGASSAPRCCSRAPRCRGWPQDQTISLDLLRRHARPGAREVHRRVGEGEPGLEGRARGRRLGPVPGQGDDARRRRHAGRRWPMSARAR